MENYIALIDGKVIGITHAVVLDMLQHVAYNVHKQKHAVKLHSITTIDVFFIHGSGSKVERRYNMFLYVVAMIDKRFSTLLLVNEKQYTVISYSGYS